MKRIQTIKLIITALVIALLLVIINGFFLPKNKSEELWPLFYELKNNTVDLIFFGNSHSHNTYNTLVFNDSLKIDSVNMGLAGISIEQVYYMLRETVKSQSPAVVVIDTFVFYPYTVDRYKTEVIHRAFDTMHLSINKIQGINFNVPKGARKEYYYPMISYHNRWMEEDIGNEIIKHIFNRDQLSYYFGFIYYSNLFTPVYNSPIVGGNQYTDEVIMPPIEKIEVLDKIVALCEKEQIQLMLVTAPFEEQAGMDSLNLQTYTNWLKPYAKEHQFELIDMKMITENINLYQHELRNEGHLNIFGSVKVSNFLVEYIRSKFPTVFEGRTYDYEDDTNVMLDEYNLLEKDLIFNLERLNKAQQLKVNDYANNLTYILELVNDPEYIVFLSYKNNEQITMTDEIRKRLITLGISECPFDQAISLGAIIDVGKSTYYEWSEDEQVNIAVKAKQNDVIFLPFAASIISSSSSTGSLSNIRIGQAQYSPNVEGINMVVYDKYLNRVVLSTSFNTNYVNQTYYDRDSDISKKEPMLIDVFDKALFSGVESSIFIDDQWDLLSNSNQVIMELDISPYNLQQFWVTMDLTVPQIDILKVYYTYESQGSFVMTQVEQVQLVNQQNEIKLMINGESPIATLYFYMGESEGNYKISDLLIIDVIK